MPNFCECTLSVEGDTEKLIQFNDQFKQKHTFFRGGKQSFPESTRNAEVNQKYSQRKNKGEIIEYKICPDGKHLNVNYIEKEEETKWYSLTNFIQMTKEDYLNGWYEWSVDNWGTKWDLFVNDFDDQFENEEICYYFQTAWSPPIPVIKEMSKQYPDCEFCLCYVDEGNNFNGTMTLKNGKELSMIETSND